MVAVRLGLPKEALLKPLPKEVMPLKTSSTYMTLPPFPFLFSPFPPTSPSCLHQAPWGCSYRIPVQAVTGAWLSRIGVGSWGDLATELGSEGAVVW